MQTDTDQKVVGVVAKNSVDYVRQVFSLLRRSETVVTLRSASDSYRIDLAGVGEVIDPENEAGWIDDLAYPDEILSDNEIAQILFTSGTEGSSKAILLSASALKNTTERLISVMEMSSEVREYVGIPVYYSFGFGRCRAVCHVGGAMYIPPNGFDPLEIAEMLGRGEINSISAVPTLWRVLLQSKELFADIGERLRWIEIGSQYMSQSEKEQLKSLFPYARIVQHYGLTEASRSTFLKVHELEGDVLESVGQPIDGVEVAIDSDGRINIRGPHLASGFIRETSTQSLTNDEGWFKTGDVGELKDGFLYYHGRSDDIINCGGVKLSPDVIEQGLYAELNIRSGLAVSRVSDQLRGEVPLIGYLPELAIGTDRIHEAVSSVLRENGLEAGKVARVFECVEFPFTETGKLQRKALTQLYLDCAKEDEGSEGLTEADPEKSSMQDPAQRLVSIWEEVLKISPISVHDSFFDLGGDSLSAITVTLKMEKSGISRETCRRIFEGLSIAEIVRAESNSQGRVAVSLENEPGVEEKTPLAAASQSLNIVRGILVLLNVAAHWMPGVVTRLPAFASEINKYFATIYSSGTPGFAIVYGAGIGFFFLPRYLKDPASVRSVLKRNLIILGSGIFCLSTVRVIWVLLAGEQFTLMTYSNSFWSVLTFYFYAVLSLYIWLKILTWRGSFSFACLSMAAIFYAIQLWLDSIGIPPSRNPVVQHFVLLLTAKYSYFDMSAGVLIGAAAGNWIRQAVIAGSSLKPFAISGLLLVLLSVILSYEMGETALWATWPKGMSIWTWPLYLGCVLISVVLVQRYIATRTVSGHMGTVSKILSIVGILAFPTFISHELVIPVKEILIELGVPFALPIALTAFFVGTGYFVHRLYSIYYGKSLFDSKASR